MADFFIVLFRNKVFLAAVLSWLVAQSLKVLLGIISEKRFNFKWFVGTGGMPSSHVAGVSALVTAVGLIVGPESVIFAVSLVFAIIVMFDAQGVRQATGIQAEVLNEITDDIYFKRGLKEEKLKELIGHTRVEVLAGALLGIIIALFVCR
jgi:hypothetical protein